MPTINADGTSKTQFSMGLGSNKIDIRSNSGVIEMRENGGSWVLAVGLVKSTSAPTTTDHSYPTGTLWMETDTKKFWICSDNTTDAAVWDPVLVGNKQGTLEKGVLEKAVSLTNEGSGNYSMDLTAGNIFVHTLTENTVLLAPDPSTLNNGDFYRIDLFIKMASTYTFEFDDTAGEWQSAGGTLPVQGTDFTATADDIHHFVIDVCKDLDFVSVGVAQSDIS